MIASYDQAKKAQPVARALFSKFAPVRTVSIVRVPDGFGLRVDVQENLPSGTQAPESVEGVPVEVSVRDDEIEAQGEV
ncbi:unnamed protein product [Gemmata massiliana]|uniref:Uncharacterized protein n=1 Tax=Gemmata massiliana TaxID=1210884 RepID=A0A6P2DPJ2_9BACT|nr:hypothetical protein [Gemmata massiliana]VTS03289.1 unnamed protein product [Gemmata massiliana]